MSSTGLFVVFEGPDGCGKTTQSKLLVEKLKELGMKAEWTSFPNRSTDIGKVIDKYLKKEINLDSNAVRLLFSANRWECIHFIQEKQSQGITVVCDRYICSGVTYSCAKLNKEVLDSHLEQEIEKQFSCDRDLLKADITFYINADVDTCMDNLRRATERTGKPEIYENREFLEKIVKLYPVVANHCNIPLVNVEYKTIDEMNVYLVGVITKAVA